MSAAEGWRGDATETRRRRRRRRRRRAPAGKTNTWEEEEDRGSLCQKTALSLWTSRLVNLRPQDSCEGILHTWHKHSDLESKRKWLDLGGQSSKVKVTVTSHKQNQHIAYYVLKWFQWEWLICKREYLCLKNRLWLRGLSGSSTDQEVMVRSLGSSSGPKNRRFKCGNLRKRWTSTVESKISPVVFRYHEIIKTTGRTFRQLF